jgi:hypothetical protein
VVARLAAKHVRGGAREVGLYASGRERLKGETPGGLGLRGQPETAP